MYSSAPLRESVPRMRSFGRVLRRCVSRFEVEKRWITDLSLSEAGWVLMQSTLVLFCPPVTYPESTRIEAGMGYISSIYPDARCTYIAFGLCDLTT